MSNGARPFAFLRGPGLEGVAEVGRIALLVGATFRQMGRGLRSIRLVVDQMHTIGVQSLVLVLIVSLFNERRRCLHDFLVGTVVINNAERSAALRTIRRPA